MLAENSPKGIARITILQLGDNCHEQDFSNLACIVLRCSHYLCRFPPELGRYRNNRDDDTVDMWSLFIFITEPMVALGNRCRIVDSNNWNRSHTKFRHDLGSSCGLYWGVTRNVNSQRHFEQNGGIKTSILIESDIYTRGSRRESDACTMDGIRYCYGSC